MSVFDVHVDLKQQWDIWKISHGVNSQGVQFTGKSTTRFDKSYSS